MLNKIVTACWCLLMVLTIFFFILSPAWAAGLWLYEVGSFQVGTASAGRGAISQDASVVHFNPAGMTKLERSQLVVGAQVIKPIIKFDVESSGFGGGDGGDAGDWTPAGSLAYVHSVNHQLKLGISAASFIGLGVDYDNDWAGRYYVREASFLTFNISPSISYQINDWLALGGSATLLYANIDQKTAINNQLTDGAGFPDGEIEVDADDVGYGFTLGALIEPSEGTRFGLVYRSKVEVDFDVRPEISGIGPNLKALLNLTGVTSREVGLEMELPQKVLLSSYHDVTDKLALVASISWQDWSSFGSTNVVVKSTPTTSFTADRNFDDTWHVGIGVLCRFSESWRWSVGVAYDSSPVDDENRTPDMPLDRQIRFGTGFQYDWNEDVTVSAAYLLTDLGDGKIDQQGGVLQGNLKGDYDTMHSHGLAFSLAWRF